MLFLPPLFYFGRSGLRPSLVQGLRPRNAPLQNHRSPTVCAHSSSAAPPTWLPPTEYAIQKPDWQRR